MSIIMTIMSGPIMVRILIIATVVLCLASLLLFYFGLWFKICELKDFIHRMKIMNKMYKQVTIHNASGIQTKFRLDLRPDEEKTIYQWYLVTERYPRWRKERVALYYYCLFLSSMKKCRFKQYEYVNDRTQKRIQIILSDPPAYSDL